MVKRLWKRLVGIILAAGVATMFAPLEARAQTCTVTDNSDDPTDTGSLRYCVNHAISGETITFAPSLVGQTITENQSASLTITTNLTIQGPGANLLTISGGGKMEVLFITNSATLTLSGLTIADGWTTGFGGGIYVNTNATLKANNCIFSGNIADRGAGIYGNPGSATTVSNSTFYGNSGEYGTRSGFGGGIFIIGSGAGSGLSPSFLKVTNSTFFGNSANEAGGGILNFGGTATVSNSTFYGNSGDAICNLSGTTTVTSSTISGNTASKGGGILTGEGTLTLTNSIVAGNTSTNDSGDDCDGCGTQSAPNLITTPDSPVDPLLASLGWYGGPTQTMIPLPGSPAIGAGQYLAGEAATDQRGFARPAPSGAVDIGAVQTNFLIVTTLSDRPDPSPDCTSGSSNNCSLRDALEAAPEGGADITFSPGLRGDIHLRPRNGPRSLPPIAGNLDLLGPGANLLAVSGDIQGSEGRIFTVNAGANAAISGITIAHGSSPTGGGIANSGSLTVSNSAISDNLAMSEGGGIYNDPGTLAVYDCSFSGNLAMREGGGIFNQAGLVMLSNSTFSGNAAWSEGGGVFNSTGILAASDSTFFGNRASRQGGGILNSSGALLALTNSIVAGNLTRNDTGDDCDGCGTPGSNLISSPGNVVNPLLGSLAGNGGPTRTLLPLPGSPAICAGSPGLIPAVATTDQRGFPRLNTSYAGYSSSSPCLDAGAVQTNYQSVQFTNASSGYSGLVNQPVRPAPVVSVIENGQSVGGVPVTLSFEGAGTARGLGPMRTDAGAGAVFRFLSVNAVGSSDTLSATLPIVGSFSLKTDPNAALEITMSK